MLSTFGFKTVSPVFSLPCVVMAKPIPLPPAAAITADVNTLAVLRIQRPVATGSKLYSGSQGVRIGGKGRRGRERSFEAGKEKAGQRYGGALNRKWFARCGCHRHRDDDCAGYGCRQHLEEAAGQAERDPQAR